MLFRTNAQSEAYEEALAEAEVPYVVRGAERFFERAEVRQAMIALRSAVRSIPGETPLVQAVVEAWPRTGWARDRPPPGGAAREQWEALAALVALAEEYARTPDSCRSARPARCSATCRSPRSATELARRAEQQHAPTVEGVTLASLHSAKGLEWDAVFLVGLADGTLPTTYAKTPEQLEEERRLLYVGVTRARQWLWLSYGQSRSPGGRARRPCRFLPQLERTGGGTERAGARSPVGNPTVGAQCRPAGSAGRPCWPVPTANWAAARPARRTSTRSCTSGLQAWRIATAAEQKVPAYVVFTDATLVAVAERRPTRPRSCWRSPGSGPASSASTATRSSLWWPVRALDDLASENFEN